MSITQPQVRNASIQMVMIPGDVSTLFVPTDINFRILFSNASNLQKTDGQYTPNNNTQVIHTFSATDQANFLLLIVDQPAVLNFTSTDNAQMITNMCVQRFLYTGIQTLASGLLTLEFNGAASGPEVPMLQNTLLNYTLIYGMAALS